MKLPIPFTTIPLLIVLHVFIRNNSVFWENMGYNGRKDIGQSHYMQTSYKNLPLKDGRYQVAPYAVDPMHTQGRRFEENHESYYISPYQRDLSRIIHSAAFRRLEYKTQVFVNHAGDHYRTRLTHTLEVAQITRAVARGLGLNEDLAECIALAHDLGHPPFGHAGEDGLKEAAKEFGGFDHNAQSLKILTKLEQKYADFDGLNLCLETLEGIAKHNGPLEGTHSKQQKLHKVFYEITEHLPFKLDNFASLEAQVAALADDIAYINHDIEDGLRAGLINIDDLKSLSLVGEILAMLEARYPNLAKPRMANECIRRLRKYMVSDLITETSRKISFLNIRSVADVRAQTETIATFSKDMEETKVQIKKFLFEKLYRHYKVNRMTIKAHLVVSDLFKRFMEHPNCLPTGWNERVIGVSAQDQAEIIIDYIAGMTDRYAIEEHKKLFDPLLD
jgi:dGTPase